MLNGKRALLVFMVCAGALAVICRVHAGVSETASYLILSAPVVPANGDSACMVSMFIKDANVNPVSGETVSLYTSGYDYFDTISASTQVTDANGQCTFAVSSSCYGGDKVTAGAGIKVISQPIFEDFSSYTEGSSGYPEWSALSGTWTIAIQHYTGDAAPAQQVYSNRTLDFSGGTLFFRVRVLNNYGGSISPRVVFHAGDNNYLSWAMYLTDSGYRPNECGIVQRIGGETYTDYFPAGKALVYNQWYEVRIEVRKEKVRYWIDGQLIRDWTRPGTFAVYTGFRLGVESARCHFDDVMVNSVYFSPTGIEIASAPFTIRNDQVSPQVSAQLQGGRRIMEESERDIATVGQQDEGGVVVPTNQVLNPAGLQVAFSGRPVGLALNPDESVLAVMNMKDLILINTADGAIKQTLAISGAGHSFNGIVYSSGGDSIFSSDSVGRIQKASISGLGVASWRSPIVLPQTSGNPVPCGMALSLTGETLYVTLNRNNTLGVINLSSETIVDQINVGIAPFDVVVVTGNKAYVSNWGGRRPGGGETTAASAGSAVIVDSRGIASDGTISVVDLTLGETIKNISVDLHPSGLALSPDNARLFVACANSDTVSVIDTTLDEVVEKIYVRPDERLPFGSAPNALVVSSDSKTLYVANGGNNAIAVITLGQNARGDGGGPLQSRVDGFIPTGWYPGAVLVNSGDTRLFVANTKGFGSLSSPTRHNSHHHLGSVSIIDIPDTGTLTSLTQLVKWNNRLYEALGNLAPARSGIPAVPVPTRHGEPSVFKHVLYIIKENRTYDQVFGDMAEGNGDLSLCEFGENVTPNQHALARQFVLLDNFNCCGVLSADGHQWTNEAYVVGYLEKAFGGFTRSYPFYGNDPLAFASSGFVWNNVFNYGLTFRDYGEFSKYQITPSSTWAQIYSDYINETQTITIAVTGAEVKSIEPYMHPTFCGWPMTVPDVYKARMFIEELEQFEASGNFPNFMIMCLPNNHTAGTGPNYPVPQAMVADNDLALGMIVDAVSHSRFWPETVIFVTEDDPQAGLDHVDGHRTVGLVISPYTKSGEVISTNYNQTGMVRTMELILGLPAMNQFDLSATPMTDCFRNAIDTAPYNVIPNNVPLNQMNARLEDLSDTELYFALKSIDLPIDRPGQKTEEDDMMLNYIIWHAVKGYNVPYPDINEIRKKYCSTAK